MRIPVRRLTAAGLIALLVWGATACDEQPVEAPHLPLPTLCTPDDAEAAAAYTDDDCTDEPDDPTIEPDPQDTTPLPTTPPRPSGCAYWGEIGCPDTPIYIPPPKIGPWS
ncbi:hypothetical protein AB0F46_28580 [Streptomyces sp. NPDC026665]|uniref:hypothetical protein n=1 Tax=Streptomyces sp. NPDC026665 TaxID=3154798 RepID=UPI0033D0B3C2